jgi:hypothetical protein
MANRNPTPRPENLRPWQPGQSGNPGGYSRGRRVRGVLRRLIAERGCEEEVALVLLAMALGRPELLPGREGSRAPDLGWWRELMHYLEDGEELEELRQAIESLRSDLANRGCPDPAGTPGWSEPGAPSTGSTPDPAVSGSIPFPVE